MKTPFILFLTICIQSLIYGQFTPPNITFNDIEPIWTFIPKDTNFVKSDNDKWSSPYWGLTPVEMRINNNKLIVLNQTISQSPRGGIEGCLLDAVDLSSGDLLWQYHSNTYTGNRHRESYYEGEMDFRDNGDIDIYGIQQIDTISKYLPQGNFYGVPFSRRIDGYTGELKSIKKGISLSSNFEGVAGVGQRIHSINDKYILIAWKNYLENSYLKENVGLYQFDESFDIVLPCNDSIEYNTNILNGLPGYSYIPRIQKINENMVVILFGANVPDSFEVSPLNLTLNYLKIQNSNEIENIKSVDVTENLIYPQTYFNGRINFEVKDQNILLSQLVQYNFDTSPYLWLSWYDAMGDKLARIDSLHIGDRYYSKVNTLAILDNEFYLIGYYNDDYEEGYDVIKVSEGHNNYTKVGKITIPKNSSISLYYNNSIVTPEGSIIMAIRVLEKVNDIPTNFLYYFNFDLEHLGLPTAVSNIKDDIELDFTIYPNPTVDKFVLELEKSINYLKVNIYDINGELVLQKEIVNESKVEIRLDHLPASIYTIHMINHKGFTLKSTKIIKN